MKNGDRPAPAAAQGPDEGTRSVGQYLASQRRLRRISLEELSERTRIPRRNLERLESGAFDAAADGFARGFVRTVAEALGLDANEAVMRLSDEPRADEVRALAAARRVLTLRITAVAALGLVALGAILYLALREPAPGDAAPAVAPSVTYRRDAVRGLAEHEQHDPDAPAPERAP